MNSTSSNGEYAIDSNLVVTNSSGYAYAISNVIPSDIIIETSYSTYWRTINFKIDNLSYEANYMMMWIDWVAKADNKSNGWIIKNDKVYNSINQICIYNVTSYDMINEGQNYETYSTAISFQIVNNRYDGDKGMAWEEWVNSSYNTSGCFIEGNHIVYPNFTDSAGSGPRYVTNGDDSNIAYITDIIIENYIYSLTTYLVG